MSQIELFKCDQVGWIRLCVIKNDEHSWASSVIDHRIIQNVGLLSCFCGRDPHSRPSNRVLPSENITEVHPLKSLGIWSWVGIEGRISSIHSKIYTLSIRSSYIWKGSSNSSSCIFYSNSMFVYQGQFKKIRGQTFKKSMGHIIQYGCKKQI